MIRQAGDARSFLENEAIALRQRLDVPARIRSSLKVHPTGWLLGSAASGLAASWFFRRKPARTEKKSSRLPFSMLGLILTVARPLAKVWLSGQVKDYLAGTQRNKAFIRPASEPPHSPTPF
ncbi:MAG: hypothetical protein V4689_19830 [Verrucomicrobiota bacterium]